MSSVFPQLTVCSNMILTVNQKCTTTCSLVQAPGEGLQKFWYGDDQSRLQNFDHLYTSKRVILGPITIPNRCKKTPNLEQIWCFFGQILQNVHWVWNWTRPSIYQKWRKSTRKPLSIPVYHQPEKILLWIKWVITLDDVAVSCIGRLSRTDSNTLKRIKLMCLKQCYY